MCGARGRLSSPGPRDTLRLTDRPFRRSTRTRRRGPRDHADRRPRPAPGTQDRGVRPPRGGAGAQGRAPPADRSPGFLRPHVGTRPPLAELTGTHGHVPALGTLDYFPPERWRAPLGELGVRVRPTAERVGVPECFQPSCRSIPRYPPRPSCPRLQPGRRHLRRSPAVRSALAARADCRRRAREARPCEPGPAPVSPPPRRVVPSRSAQGYSTIASSRAVALRRRPPSSVTVTMSSIRTPKRPGR